MVLRQGAGRVRSATDRVRVNYQGALLDGTVFDSSYERGQPTEFALNQVIPGWTEGLALMPVGAKYRFWIPGDLAYGAKGTPEGSIGPNATLVFDVELLAILLSRRPSAHRYCIAAKPTFRLGATPLPCPRPLDHFRHRFPQE